MNRKEITAEKIATFTHMTDRYTVYRAPGKGDDALSWYYGAIKGEHDRPPYCSDPSVKSVLLGLGISARTPVNYIEPDTRSA